MDTFKIIEREQSGRASRVFSGEQDRSQTSVCVVGAIHFAKAESYNIQTTEEILAYVAQVWN